MKTPSRYPATTYCFRIWITGVLSTLPRSPRAGAACQSISISASTAPFTLTLSGTLTIDDGGSISAAIGTQAVAITGGSGITASGTLTVDNDNASGMTISCSDITGNASDLITFSGSENIGVSAIITDSGGGNPVTVSMDDADDVVTLSAANTFTGLVTLTQGILSLSNVDAYGTGAGGISLGGGTLLINVIISAANWDPAITLTGDAALRNAAGSTYIDEPINLGNNTLTITNSTTLYISGVISGTGGLTCDSASFVALQAANTFSGAISVTNGQFHLQNVDAFGTGAGGITLGNSANLVLDLAINAGDWDPAITITGTGSIIAEAAGCEIDQTINLNANTLTLLGSEDFECSGVISGTGGITVLMATGADVATLSGANDFSGLITVTQGVLALDDVDAFGTGAGGISLGGGTLLMNVIINAANWDPAITLTNDSTIRNMGLGSCEIDEPVNLGAQYPDRNEYDRYRVYRSYQRYRRHHCRYGGRRRSPGSKYIQRRNKHYHWICISPQR